MNDMHRVICDGFADLLEHVVDGEKAGEAIALLRHYYVVEKKEADGGIEARPCDPQEPTL